MPVAPTDTLMIRDQAGMRTAGKRTAETSRLHSSADRQFQAIMLALETFIKQHIDMINIISRSFAPTKSRAIVRTKQASNAS